MDAYCNYIIQNKDILRVDDGVLMASVLDGIGDPQKTLDNQNEMERRGATPLPCFHFGEDPSFLLHYMKNYKYITIGGMVGKSNKQLAIWLDHIWDNYMTDGAGRPVIKAHGFGLTSTFLMERYPWYSCDSSSWIQAAAFGSFIDPEHGPMPVSNESPARHVSGQHLSTLTPTLRDWYHARIESQGFYADRLASVYESRAVYNLWSYGQVNKRITKLKMTQDGFNDAVQELF
jgi:hypothetical protein